MISPVEMTFTSSPKFFAIEAPRISSSNRPCVSAMVIEPFCLKPVAWPVSRLQPLEEPGRVLGELGEVAAWRAAAPTRPAACQVVPQVSCLRSSSTVFVMPILVR